MIFYSEAERAYYVRLFDFIRNIEMPVFKDAQTKKNKNRKDKNADKIA